MWGKIMESFFIALAVVICVMSIARAIDANTASKKAELEKEKARDDEDEMPPKTYPPLKPRY